MRASFSIAILHTQAKMIYKGLLTSLLIICVLLAARAQSGKFVSTCRPVPDFCVDCGDEGTEAAYIGSFDAYFIDKLDPAVTAGLNGQIIAQIIINTSGKVCTHNIQYETDKSSSSLRLERLLDKMYWTPAIEDGEKVTVSTMLEFKFENGSYTVSNLKMGKERPGNMWSEGDVRISNKRYRYSSERPKEHLQVFQKKNSAIPYDMSRAIAIDRKGIVWHGTDDGLVRIEGEKMSVFNADNISVYQPTSGSFLVSDIVVDARNVKWMIIDYRLYSYHDRTWKLHGPADLGITNVNYLALDNKGNVTVFEDTLAQWTGSLWKLYDSAAYRLPSSNLSGMYEDRNGVIWLGTYDGNVRIINGKATRIKDAGSALAKAAITKGCEDKAGNIWFLLSGDKKPQSGILRKAPDGRETFYNVENSGLPGSYVEAIIPDDDGVGFWATVSGVGMVRFDGKAWRLLTRDNSAIPSAEIPDIAKDSQGRIWAATFYGLCLISP